MMKIFSSSIQSLERGLQYSAKKHEVTSHNIANVDTPNYKRREVQPTFQQIYNSALSANKTDKRHLDFSNSPSSTHSVKTAINSYSHNGNNVDIDKEMSELAENQIYYYTLVDQLSGKFQSLQNVIKGGRN